MKWLKYVFQILTLVLFCACEDEDIFKKNKGDIQVEAGFASTRTTFVEDNGTTHVSWEVGDKIGLITNGQSNLQYEALNDGSSTLFSAVGEKLNVKEGDKVYAYLQNIWHDVDGFKIQLPSTYEQEYEENASDYDFIYSSAPVNNNKVSLSFKHIYAFLKITIPLNLIADRGERGGIAIESSEIIVANSSVFDIEQEKLLINNASQFIDYSIPTDKISDGQQEVTCYIAILPQSAGTELKIYKQIKDNMQSQLGDCLLTKKVPESGFKAGNVYTLYLNENETETIRQKERDALIALYKATDGDNWINKENWCSDKPLSEWYGVYTGTDSNVLGISLGQNNLKGVLPEELGNLVNLTGLTLWDNQLTGELPNEIGNLKLLTDLHLSNNQFSGQIPDVIWSLPALRVLSLSTNLFTKISSEIKQAQTLERLNISYNSIYELPDEIGELIALTDLDIRNNPIKYLPDNMGNLKKLQTLSAGEMNLSGSFPSFIGQFTSLKELSLEMNNLNGNIPESIGNLKELTSLWLQGNQINGNIPESIGNLKCLQTLYLNDNQIGGTIPESICNLVNLSILDISNNNIAGSLPTNIGNLVKLEWFKACDNQLGGTIPESVAGLKQLSIFDVSNNNIEGSIPKGFAELPLLESLMLRMNRLSGAVPIELYQCPHWNDWDPFSFIYTQQEGYILYPENYYVSTDFSKDGDVIVLQNHAKGTGIKLVLMGDLFVDTDMEDGGVYETAMRKTMEGYFSIEPFKSLRDYFDVVTIKAVSKHDWMSGESAFETTNQPGMGAQENKEKCVEYAQKALGVDELRDVAIVLLLKNYPAGHCVREISDSGITSFACVGYEYNDAPGEFEESLYWVANGFGFGLLGEEYIIDNAKVPENIIQNYKDWYSLYGCYANVDFTSDPNQVRWSHFINDPRYSDEEIGIYEGAKWAYGIYRPTEYSVMRESINGFCVINQFNAPSREAIYKRAMELAYGDSWTYDYEEFVKFDAQGHADFVAAKNKIVTKSIGSTSPKEIKYGLPRLKTVFRK